MFVGCVCACGVRVCCVRECGGVFVWCVSVSGLGAMTVCQENAGNMY